MLFCATGRFGCFPAVEQFCLCFLLFCLSACDGVVCRYCCCFWCACCLLCVSYSSLSFARDSLLFALWIAAFLCSLLFVNVVGAGSVGLCLFVLLLVLTLLFMLFVFPVVVVIVFLCLCLRRCGLCWCLRLRYGWLLLFCWFLWFCVGGVVVCNCFFVVVVIVIVGGACCCGCGCGVVVVAPVAFYSGRSVVVDCYY